MQDRRLPGCLLLSYYNLGGMSSFPAGSAQLRKIIITPEREYLTTYNG